MSLSFYLRLYRYGMWANRETMTALENLAQPPSTALNGMAHIVAAEWLWLGRVQNADPGISVWPSWTPEECRSRLETGIRKWESYLAICTDKTLTETCSYANSRGERFTSPLADILTHIGVHGGYHRGQIAAALRAAGITPPYTDFIHAARQDMIP